MSTKPFQGPYAPTLEELVFLADQMKQAEWLRLMTNAEFLQSTLISGRECAAVASQLLGRKISAAH